MKINKYWKLTSSLEPCRPFVHFEGASKEQYDSVCIIHFDKHFIPIVLDERKVLSISRWTVKGFYNGINKAISIARFGGRLREKWDIRKYGKDKACWGCRIFTIKQLLTIREAMEEHYGRERLGK